MDLLEYQGKQLFSQFGIPVSPGQVASNPNQAVEVAESLGYPVVVKAQVLIGGRGKAGGIQLASNAEEVRTHAENILDMSIRGHIVHVLWIERASDIDAEYYASFTFDRSARMHLGMLSAKGGIDIEEVADTDPDAIARLHVNPADGLDPSACRDWVERAHLDPQATEGAADVLAKLYQCYVASDADLVEINPLILTTDGHVHALDAKVTLDVNAQFRHSEWNEYEATQPLDERELAAKKHGLNYIGLEGNIGIIGNGAGLVMSTLDVVNQVGGKPANFLDVGGGASAEILTHAVEVINADPTVRAILINIFGGITKCDDVARGIIAALQRVEIQSPIVVRLDGTNADEGRQILSQYESDQLVPQPTMLDAAREAVALAGA